MGCFRVAHDQIGSSVPVHVADDLFTLGAVATLSKRQETGTAETARNLLVLPAVGLDSPGVALDRVEQGSIVLSMQGPGLQGQQPAGDEGGEAVAALDACEDRLF